MKTVMIVEEDDVTRDLLHSSVGGAAYHFASISVARSECALSLLESGLAVDMVVSDATEQEMPALAFLERVIALRPNVPVVVLAKSMSLESDLLRGGAAAVLQRGLHLDVLVSDLTRILVDLMQASGLAKSRPCKLQPAELRACYVANAGAARP